MPYAHNYANSVGEVGIIETLKRFSPSGIVDTMLSGAMSVLTLDQSKLMKMLVDAEMNRFEGVCTPVVFLHNCVTDWILGIKGYHMFSEFYHYIKDRYGAEAGFITINLPLLVQMLEDHEIENPIVCANFNKIGLRMCGGVELYKKVIAEKKCRFVAISVFASCAKPAGPCSRVPEDTRLLDKRMLLTGINS